MAIDSRIALNLQPLNVGQRFAQNVQNLQQVDLLNQRREQAPFQNQLLQLQTELAQTQQPANLLKAERAASPLTQQLLTQQQMDAFDLSNAQALKPFLDSNDAQGAIAQLNRQKQQAQELGLADEVAEVDAAIQAIQSPEGFGRVKQATDSFLHLSGGIPQAQQKSVSQREREQALSVLEKDPDMETLQGKEAGVFLGLRPRSSISAEERIAQDKQLSELVAENKRLQAEKTETAKLTAQKKFKPEIAKAVKLAEKEATEKGEVLTDLARMEASLPGVKEAVSQLIELSNVATSTLGGRAFDFIVKESGFGSTKGADARAKLVAIVDNQVLPLLKETFGAAFTVQEGENLKASLVDPNASPSQKREQLEAFLAQKERNIRTKQTQLGQAPAATGFKILSVE